MNVSSQHRINCRTPEGNIVTGTVPTTDHKGQTYTDIATPQRLQVASLSIHMLRSREAQDGQQSGWNFQTEIGRAHV